MTKLLELRIWIENLIKENKVYLKEVTPKQNIKIIKDQKKREDLIRMVKKINSTEGL